MNGNGVRIAVPPRRSPPRSLAESCREAGVDDLWRRCPDCPLRFLCESEERWLVRRAPRQLS